MIIDDYSVFRNHINPAGTPAPDGLPEFPVANMRAFGFDGGITSNPTSAFPLEITVNAYADDAVDGVDEYDWFVSQRTSVAANKPFTVYRLDTPPTTRSGSIGIDMTAQTSAENPDPFDLSTIPVLFFAVDIYAIRRTDKSIQRLDLASYIYNANVPKTNIG